jgi:hypothetical protein
MKKRTKSTAGLSSDAKAWLEGSGPSFTQFKNHDELVALWKAYGNENIATWDMDEDSRPVALD